MKSRKQQLVSAALACVMFSTSVPLQAAGYYYPAPQRDVDACVAEISRQADYDEAARVRHEFTSATERSVGYVFEINTKVYATGSGAVVREYESVCVATGGRKPSKFRIAEKGV
jgi:hypothetical protein